MIKYLITAPANPTTAPTAAPAKPPASPATSPAAAKPAALPVVSPAAKAAASPSPAAVNPNWQAEWDRTVQLFRLLPRQVGRTPVG